MPEPLASLAAELEDFHQQRRPVVFEWNALHLVEEHLFVICHIILCHVSHHLMSYVTWSSNGMRCTWLKNICLSYVTSSYVMCHIILCHMSRGLRMECAALG